MIDHMNLPQSARDALHYMAIRMAEGYTGSFRLECVDGGVRYLVPEESLKPEQLAEYRRLKRAS